MTSWTAHTHWARLVVVVTAVVAAVVVWLVEHPVSGIRLEVRTSDTTQEVGLVAVVLASLFTGLAAWLGVVVLSRWSAHPRRTWLVVSAVVLLVSLIGPLTAATAPAAVMSLVCLHVVVALALVPGFAHTLDRVRSPR